MHTHMTSAESVFKFIAQGQKARQLTDGPGSVSV